MSRVYLAGMAAALITALTIPAAQAQQPTPPADPKHAAGVIDPNKREAAEAANVRACRLAGAISRMSATYQQGLLTLQRKRTGGNQQVTVKHIHQQVNVTQGGQAVVAGDTVTRGQGERRRGMIEK
jgi:hypothetical protein